MKIVAGTISSQGCGYPTANSNRLDLYRQILSQSRERNCDVVCLPGGYLAAQSNTERDKLAEKLAEEAEKNNIAIVIGIDVLDNRSAFAVSWVPAEEQSWHTWQQRSSNSTDWRPENERYYEQRTLTLPEGAIEVLICGEIFNPVIRRSIIERSNNLTAVVDIAHQAGRGFNRATRPMLRLSKQANLVVLYSINTQGRGIYKHLFDHGENMSTANSDIVMEGPTWAELKIWDV